MRCHQVRRQRPHLPFHSWPAVQYLWQCMLCHVQPGYVLVVTGCEDTYKRDRLEPTHALLFAFHLAVGDACLCIVWARDACWHLQEGCLSGDTL